MLIQTRKIFKILILVSLITCFEIFGQCNISKGIFIDGTDTSIEEHSFTKWNNTNSTIMFQKLLAIDNSSTSYRIYFIVQKDKSFANKGKEKVELKLILKSQSEILLLNALIKDTPFGMKNKVAFYSDLSKTQMETIARTPIMKMKILDMNFTKTWYCRKRQKLIARCLLR